MMKKFLSKWGSGEDGKGKKSSARSSEGLVRGPDVPAPSRNGTLLLTAGPGEYGGQESEPPDAGPTRTIPSFITNAANLPSYGLTAPVPLPLPTAPVALPLPEPCSPPHSLPNSHGHPQSLPNEDSTASRRFNYPNQGLTRLVPEGDPATSEKGVSTKNGLTISHSGANKSSFASPRRKGIASVFKSTPRGKSSNQNPLPFNFPNQRPSPLEVLTGAKRTAVKPVHDSSVSEPNASPQTLSDLATPSPNMTPRSAPDWTSAVPPISPFWNKHSPNAANPLHQKLRRSPSLTSNPETNSVDNSTTSSPLSRFSPVGQHANLVAAAGKVGKSAPSSPAHSDAYGKPDGSASGVSITSAVSEPPLETDSTELARTLSDASESPRSVASPRSSVGDELREGGEAAPGRVLLGLTPWEETLQSEESTEESSTEGSESTESSAAGNWLNESSPKQGGGPAPSLPPPGVHFDLNPPSEARGVSSLFPTSLASPRGKTAAVLLSNDPPSELSPVLGSADTFEPLREVRKKEVGEEDLTRSITPRTAEALRLSGGLPDSSGVAGSKSPQRAVGGPGNRVQRPLNTHLNVPKQLTPIKAGPAWHESIAGLPVSSSESSSSGPQAHPLPDIGRTLTPPSGANTPSPRDGASPLPPPHPQAGRGSSRVPHGRNPSDPNSNHLRTSSEGRLKSSETVSPNSTILIASGILDGGPRNRPIRGQSDPARVAVLSEAAYLPRPDAHPLPSSDVARTLSDPLVARGTKRASLDLDSTPLPLPLPLPPSEDRSVKAASPGQVLTSPGQASPMPLLPHTAYPLNHSAFPVNKLGSHASSSPSAASTRSLSPHASPISVLPQGTRTAREFRGGSGDQGPKMPVNWRKGDKLGSGTFGSVYRGMNSDNGEMFAVKEVGEAQASDESRLQLEQEVALLSRLKHPNIVQYVGTKREDSRLYIFLEFMPGGSIESLLRCYGLFEESLIRVYTKQILCGLKYLHDQSTIHRDIKGANLLVDINGTVKLADFGMAKQIREGHSLAQSGMKGSPFWMAPEVVRGERQGRPADIWSVGCTVLEMAQGFPPWSRDCANHIQIIYKIASSNDCPHIPEHLSETAVDFIKLCLNRSPDTRPSVDDLLNHPFIADVAPETPPEMATVLPRASPPGTPSPRPVAQVDPRTLLRTGQAPPSIPRLSRQSSGKMEEGEPSVSATVAALVDAPSGGLSVSRALGASGVVNGKQSGNGPKLRPKTPPPNWSPNGAVTEELKPGIRVRIGEVGVIARELEQPKANLQRLPPAPPSDSSKVDPTTFAGDVVFDTGGASYTASALLRHKSADAPKRRPLGTLLEDDAAEFGRLHKGLSVPIGVGKKEGSVVTFGPAIRSS